MEDPRAEELLKARIKYHWVTVLAWLLCLAIMAACGADQFGYYLVSGPYLVAGFGSYRTYQDLLGGLDAYHVITKLCLTRKSSFAAVMYCICSETFLWSIVAVTYILISC